MDMNDIQVGNPEHAVSPDEVVWPTGEAHGMLVSFCVKCHNQEAYVGEALDYAFAQTYHPLEIVICDDASTDSSDQVIRDRLDEYRKRQCRHEVRYYRNRKNLGNLGNWQHLCKQARGELLVKADGDDFSKPDRTETLVHAWVANGKSAKVVVSDAVAIDDKGTVLWPVYFAKIGMGCVAAFHKSLVSEFPDLIEGVAHDGADDMVYMNRARLLSGETSILHIPHLLVFYRQGSGETTSGIGLARGMGYMAARARSFKFIATSCRQMIADCEHLCKNGKLALLDQSGQILKALRHSVLRHSALEALWGGTSFIDRFKGAIWLWRDKSYGLGISFFLLLPHCLTRPLLDAMAGVWRYIRAKRAIRQGVAAQTVPS